MPPNENDAKMRILMAAKKLFAKQGFDATSVRQICEEAGANVALVSYYFGGKENMLQAVFQAFFPVRQLKEQEHELQDPVEGLRLLIREVINLRERDRDLITILQQEIVLMSPRIDQLREMVFPVWRKFRELLQQGREQGVFAFESLDNTLLFSIGSILIHKQRDYWQPLMEGPEPGAEELISQTIDYILNAVNYKGGGPKS